MGGGHDKEGAGRRAGLPGGREVSSYIDCFRKRILQLLAAQLNKSGCSKGSDGISRPPQGPPLDHTAPAEVGRAFQSFHLTPPPKFLGVRRFLALQRIQKIDLNARIER